MKCGKQGCTGTLWYDHLAKLWRCSKPDCDYTEPRGAL